ncbi:MAG: hypothetical protein ACOQNV_00910 [Mycoplasmoidaceae bacterium]
MSKQTNQTDKKKKRKFMAIFFPILGAAVIATGVTLGCVYGCKKNGGDTPKPGPIIPWTDIFDDPGEAERHQASDAISSGATYNIDLKEELPEDEMLWGNGRVVATSHQGVKANIGGIKLDPETRKAVSFVAAIDEVPSPASNTNGPITYWADFEVEVQCKKTAGDETVWTTTIEELRLEVEVLPVTPPFVGGYMSITTDVNASITIAAMNIGDWDESEPKPEAPSIENRVPSLQYWDDGTSSWQDITFTIMPGEWDNDEWTQFCIYTINTTAGKPVYVRGNNPEGLSKYVEEDGFDIEGSQVAFTTESSEANWTVGGTPLALVNNGSEEAEDLDSIDTVACFSCLFENNENLKIIENPNEFLPATELSANCYESMFAGCKKLINLPALPADIVKDFAYRNMFYHCDALTSIPSNYLPASEVDESGCESMFEYCTGLTTNIMTSLPADTLGTACYKKMFNHCDNLVLTPELPSTSLAESCYELMFQQCKGLITCMNELPATDLEQSCYSGMFHSCTSLTNCMDDLPATNLAESCYEAMFYYCTALTAAPKLHATVMETKCYKQMFEYTNVPVQPMKIVQAANECCGSMYNHTTPYDPSEPGHLICAEATSASDNVILDLSSCDATGITTPFGNMFYNWHYRNQPYGTYIDTPVAGNYYKLVPYTPE